MATGLLLSGATRLRTQSPTKLLFVSTATQPSIGVDPIADQTQGATFTVTGTYTVAAPTSMSYTFSLTGDAGTLASFTASNGTWSGSLVAPSTTGKTGIAFRASGPNSDIATSNVFNLIGSSVPLEVAAGNIWFATPPPNTRAIALTGSHHWPNLQDFASLGAFDFTAYVNYLVSKNHNHIRLWSWMTPRWRGLSGQPTWDFTISPMPWNRPGPGTAADGGPKFDLTSFNSAYFTRLRSRCQQAGTAGLYVTVQLFNGFADVDYSGQQAWTYAAFNANNNINAGTSNVSASAETINTAINNLQKLYIDQVLAATGDLLNVMYEICNEGQGPVATSAPWQTAMADYITAHRPHPNLEGTTAQGVATTEAAGVSGSSSFQWYAPGQFWTAAVAGTAGDAPAVRPVILDTDHIWGAFGGSADWAWSNFCRGYSIFYMDDLSGTGIAGAWVWPGGAGFGLRDLLRTQMGGINIAVGLLGSNGLNSVVPHDALSSTGLCLANPGTSYIAYNVGHGAFTMNLSASSANFTATWIDTTTNTQSSGGTIPGGSASQTVTPPGGLSGGCALVLVTAAPSTIAINAIANQTEGATFNVAGTWTGSAPPGMNCSFSIGAGGSTSVTSFTVPAGTNTWNGQVVAPNLVGATTLAVTSTGSGAPSATSNSFNLTAVANSLTLDQPPTETLGQPFSVSGKYTGAAPSTPTYSFSGGGGSGSLTSYSASAGLWNAQVPAAPSSGTSTTLTVTGTGANISSDNKTFNLQAASAATSLVEFAVNELSGTTAPAGSIFEFAQAFPQAAVPSGSKLVGIDTSNNVFQIQQDEESTAWGDGSLKTAVISLLTPSSVAGGTQVRGFHIGRQSGSPNRTGVSAAQIAANSNIVLTCSGYDCGGNTYQVSFNEVVANFLQGPAWGTNYPIGGWEYTRQGPVCTAVRAVRYLRNTSTGNPHATVRAMLTPKLWARSYGSYTLTGFYDIDCTIEQVNSYGPISATADGASGSPGNGQIGGRFFCTATITNNGAVVPGGYLGGPNDPRATTGISFNASNNQVSSPPPWATNTVNDQLVAVSFSTLPSLLTASSPYFIGYINAANGQPSGYYIFKSRWWAMTPFYQAQSGVNNADNFVAYGGSVTVQPWDFTFVNGQYFHAGQGAAGTTAGVAPSGNDGPYTDGSVLWIPVTMKLGSAPAGVTTFPLWGCFQFGMQAAADSFGKPLWTGPSARVRVWPGHDFAYLQSSKFIHKYYAANRTASLINVTNTPPTFNIGSNPGTGGDSSSFWWWQYFGDDPAEERYLPLNMSTIACLYAMAPGSTVDLNTKRFYAQKSTSLALNFFDLPVHYGDERHLRQMVINNGHAKDGVTYTNCAPVNPTFVPFYTEGSPLRGTLKAASSYTDLSGYTAMADGRAAEFATWDGTHYATSWQGPWLSDGRHIWLEEAKYLGIVCTFGKFGFGASGGYSDRIMTVGGTTYYATVFGNAQIRDWAADLTKIGQCVWAMSASDPLNQMYADILADNGGGAVAYTGIMTGNIKALGCPGLNGVDQQRHSYSPWHGFLLYISVCQLADRYGGSWETYRQHLTNFVGCFSSSDSPNGSPGCTYECGLFDLFPFNSGLTDWQPNASALFQHTYDGYGLGTFSCVGTSVISQPCVRGGVWYPPPPSSQAIPLFGTSIYNLYRAGARWRQILGDGPANSLISDLDTRAASFGGTDYHSAKAGANIGNFLQGNS